LKKNHRIYDGDLSADTPFTAAGCFNTMHKSVTEQQKKYWDMAAVQCHEDAGGDTPATRFKNTSLPDSACLL
jgi:hypothetical protein